jgi:hypothetical protein
LLHAALCVSAAAAALFLALHTPHPKPMPKGRSSAAVENNLATTGAKPGAKKPREKPGPAAAQPRSSAEDQTTITLFSSQGFLAYLKRLKTEKLERDTAKRSRQSLNSLSLDEQIALAMRLSLGEAGTNQHDAPDAAAP